MPSHTSLCSLRFPLILASGTSCCFCHCSCCCCFSFNLFCIFFSIFFCIFFSISTSPFSIIFIFFAPSPSSPLLCLTSSSSSSFLLLLLYPLPPVENEKGRRSVQVRRARGHGWLRSGLPGDQVREASHVPHQGKTCHPLPKGQQQHVQPPQEGP